MYIKKHPLSEDVEDYYMLCEIPLRSFAKNLASFAVIFLTAKDAKFFAKDRKES